MFNNNHKKKEEEETMVALALKQEFTVALQHLTAEDHEKVLNAKHRDKELLEEFRRQDNGNQ